MIPRVELKERAKQTMQGNWSSILPVIGLVAVINVCIQLISNSSESFNLGDLLGLLLEGPLMVAFLAFMLHLMRHRTATTSEFFAPFSNFVKYMLAGLWMTLWLVLWTLLLIIPGCVKFFSYSQYYFILADNPDADLRGALKTSMKMTNGYKGELFFICLSFINWWLAIAAISILSVALLPVSVAGLVIVIASAAISLYLAPYMGGTFVGVYEYLRADAIGRGVCSPEEFGRGVSNAASTTTYDLASEPTDKAEEIILLAGKETDKDE